mmetsp:Transcript_29390/g.73979  ORF Transcript_29390/g.73979 Transcript_29390/m.73979 type:complete len:229 (-) Transcript_29390:294-980(-)|eukprot:CAMPEP_0177653666 /NCGR_PEP_ID=MMETSP0447-20121125/13871_1 /TAXON_ID=0 /ORGANISM="Stygamoeba regulata, Strain BSH-02190019" /LENGTH=228 /DNA_ID=CAMNT_0019157165 /DNA_START=71 /DNA_END=757 /DNA_ORIENTATION=+
MADDYLAARGNYEDATVADMPVPPLPGRELASIDFEALIGGPLVATIHAQVQAAMATVNFVKTVGFEQPMFPNFTPNSQATGKPSTVSFEYIRNLPDGSSYTSKLHVPLLTMVPIPTLRIDEVTLDFLAKVNTVAAKSIDTSVGMGAEAAQRWNLFLYSSGMKVSSVFQKHTKEGNVVTRDYSINMRVKAVQDETPAGLDKLLTLLEMSIKDDATIPKGKGKAEEKTE